jgi:large subunit ribosomal protein L35
MPKMKSNSGAKKRFSFTATGKVKFRRTHRSHLLTKKSSKRKRRLSRVGIMADVDVTHVVRMLPYGV